MNQAQLIMTVFCCIDHWIVFHHYSAPGQTPKDSSWLVKQYPASSFPASYRSYHSTGTAGQSIREIREVFCVVYGEKPIKFAIWSNYNDWSTNQCHVLYFLINLKNCMNSSVNVYTVRDVRMYLHSTPSSANLEIMLWMIYIVWVCFFTKFEPNISHGFEKIIKYFIAFVNSWEGWAWSCNYI